jgi:hypothetical protein
VKLIGILACNFGRKTRTARSSQPDDPNPDTAEPMVKNVHRTLLASEVSFLPCAQPAPLHAFSQQPVLMVQRVPMLLQMWEKALQAVGKDLFESDAVGRAKA